MKKSFILPALLLGITFGSCAQSKPAPVPTQTAEKEQVMLKEGLSTATFAAGCFWCVEAIFQDVKGVHKVASGYTDGKVKNPTYRDVCNGTTGHAEALQIQFDPMEVSYEDLVKIFFATHDPTTLNRQGADAGTQYRSGIYFHDEEQKAIAERTKKDFAPTLWDDPVVTEIKPASEFYVAEEYHQNYFNDNADQPYCRIVINPKVQKFRAMFADKLK